MLQAGVNKIFLDWKLIPCTILLHYSKGHSYYDFFSKYKLYHQNNNLEKKKLFFHYLV